MAEIQKSTLQALLAAEPPPLLPDWNRQWSLEAYQKVLDQFHRKLLEYIRRLMQRLTKANILQEIGGNGLFDWRYHAATHKFQVKRFQDNGSIGDWEDAAADQPVAATEMYDWQYDTSLHKFQKKTQALYVLEAASASGWTDVYTAQSVTNLTEWHYDATSHKFQYKTQADYVLEKASVSSYTNAPADQPVSLARVDRQITYDSGAQQLLEDFVVDVYVLEKGSNTDDYVITTAEVCGT